jgi:hypothetical protein
MTQTTRAMLKIFSKAEVGQINKNWIIALKPYQPYYSGDVYQRKDCA